MRYIFTTVSEYPRMQMEEVMASKKTTTKDKFGLRTGTNTHKAAALFAKGATMADVKKATGGNQYNILHWLKRQGHKITRKDGFITVTPKAETT